MCVCECVCVPLVIQHAMRLRHTVIRGLFDSTAFFHTLINGTIFLKEKVVEHKVCFDFLYKFCLRLSHAKNN